MADKKVIALEVQVDDGKSLNSLQALKKEIKDLTAASLAASNKGDITLARKLANDAGDAKNKLQDLNKSINATVDTGNKLQSFAKVGATIASGFSAAQGAAALFGSSGQQLEKVLLKVQAATALAQGAQALANATEDIAIAKQVVYSTVTNIASAASKLFGISAAAAMALATAGITLLVAGVVALITYLSFATDESEKLAEQEKKRKDQSAADTKFQNDSDLKALQHKLELLQAQKASEDEIFNAQQSITKRKLELVKEELNAKELSSERSKQLLLEQSDLQSELDVQDATRLSNKNDADKKSYDEHKKQLEANGKEELQIREELAIDGLAQRKTELERLQKIEDDANKLRLENAKIADEEKIKADAITAQRELDARNERIRSEQEGAAKRIELEKSIKDAKQLIIQSSINTIANLGNLFIKNQKKLEKFQKKVAVTQLLIDTAKAISTTIASATAAAAAGGPAAPFLIAGYIASGIATVTTAFAQAKSLLSKAGESVSDSLGGAASGGGSGAVAPAPVPIQQASTLIPNQNVGGNASNTAPVPIRAYVVETDVTQKQSRVSRIEGAAKFG